jgi:hypothetical protein
LLLASISGRQALLLSIEILFTAPQRQKSEDKNIFYMLKKGFQTALR